MLKRPLSKHYPYLTPIIKKAKIFNKSTQYIKRAYQLEKTELFKTYKVYKTQSLLRRPLGNINPSLQEAKIQNLKLAIPKISGIVIKPNHIFSLWKIIGKPDYKNGYVDGMLLADGKVTTGVGGGLCQLANLVHWLFLHTGMEIKEHWHHNYDVFPDSGRAIPFGSGAGVLYNYFDLQYFNPTNETYTLKVYLTDKHLAGEVWSNKPQNLKYKIKEEEHKFYKKQNQVFRENKLYKITIDKVSGNTIDKKLVKHNKSKVLYPVSID